MNTKFVFILILLIATSGCAIKGNVKVEHGLVFGTPVEQMITSVSNKTGYELTTVQTFVQQQDGRPVMIDSNSTGGPGMVYAVGTAAVAGVTNGTGAATIGGAFAVEAASKIRPDQTEVNQFDGDTNVESKLSSSLVGVVTAVQDQKTNVLNYNNVEQNNTNKSNSNSTSYGGEGWIPPGHRK